MPGLLINRLNFQRAHSSKAGGTSFGLHDVSLSIPDARLVVISGPNGSGKTTLLKNIAGLFGKKDAVSGEISFSDSGNLLGLTAPEQRAWKNQGVAYMTQEAQLDRGLNALRNVALPLIIRGLKRSEAYRIAREKLQEVGLPEKEKAFPEQLSGGERQLVALARALAQDAKVLLLDEPTANIDVENSARMISLLQGQVKQGKLVILVTHEEEMKNSRECQQIRMDEGRIVENVVPKEIISRRFADQAELTGPTRTARARAVLNRLLFAVAASFAPGNKVKSALAIASPALAVAGMDMAYTLEENGLVVNFQENTAAALGPVSLTETGYQAGSSDPADHLLARGKVVELAETLGQKVGVFPRLQAVCNVGVNGKTRGMNLLAVEKGDPLPLERHLVAGQFTFRPGEIYLGEHEARELGLTAASLGRELTLKIFLPEEGVKYGTVKLAGIISGNVKMAGAAFLPIGFVQDLMDMPHDQAPNFILTFDDIHKAAAAAAKLKQSPLAQGLSVSAFSENAAFRGTDAYLNFVEFQLVLGIFLAAASFQLYINARQMTGQEEHEIALRRMLGSSRRTAFSEYFGKLMALYGLGTVAAVGAYAPVIHHAETDGVSFIGHTLDAISVDWTFYPKTLWSEILGGAAGVAGLAAAASALAVRKSLSEGNGRAQTSTLLAGLEQGEGNWSRHWSLFNLARNMRRNGLTFLVPSSAFFFILFDTAQFGMLRDARRNQAWTTIPELQVSRAEHPNDPLNFEFKPFPLASVPPIAGEEARTGRVALLGQLSQAKAAETEQAMVFGLDPQTDRGVFPRICQEVVEGDCLSPGGIILPRKTAEHLGVKVGSAVSLTAQTEGYPPNALDLKVDGISESANPNVTSHSAFVSLSDARALMGLPSEAVTEVDVTFNSFKRAARAAEQLRAAQPAYRYHDFLARSQDMDNWENGAYLLEGIFSGMLLLATTYGAYSYVSNSLTGRRREIYNMQANGLSLGQIKKIINREIALASACGGGAFALLGIAASLYMERFGLDLSTFSSGEGIMGLPITLDHVHGNLSYLSALLAAAFASAAPSLALRAKVSSLIKPFKEPEREPFLLEPDETGAAEPDDEKTAISVKGLTVAYNGTQGRSVLNIPKFSVAKGEYVVITGPNGSGKTTLLEALAAMYVPTTGQITVRNQGEEIQVDQLANDEARAKYRSDLAIIPQDLGLFEDLTVEENVYFGLRGNARLGAFLGEAEIKAQVSQALRDLEIDDIRKVKVSQLSGGQRQRVAIARALAKSPEILLIDEATANLDHESKEKFRDLVSRLNNTKKITVVFVSHDELITKQDGVRVVKLVKGRIVN
jgi:ABC-type lipoprotein export system ATPase subunit/ABC-type lipoprotein release transport system permease subunit